MERKALEEYLAKVYKKGKLVYGIKEVVDELKGSKAIIASKTLDQKSRQKLQRDCKKLSIPFIEYDGTSLELGKAIGKRFRVSALSIKSTGGYDIKEIFHEEPKS
ncbi:MAG: ribosomal L7Ae/L30e/S12e/Gadd45 family protein [Nitrososphaeria archaeon]